MFNWINKPRYRVIEVDRPRPTNGPEGDALRDALHSLQNHPAMQYILNRLSLQQSALTARLKTTKFQHAEDIVHLQSGIFWAGWLERELALLTQTPPKPELPAYDQEIQAFHDLDQMLERVGTESNV